jgi:regulator of protease activity HflC (stomatin/prohibitin superfamily)
MIHRALYAACLAALVLSLQACGTTVQPGYRGLVFRPLSVGLSTDPVKEGTYFLAPWNSLVKFDVRWQSFTEKIDALTADDLPVSVHGAITIRPIAGEIYFLTQEVGPRWYEELVKPQFLSAVRSVISNYTMVSIPERSTEIGNKIEAVLFEALKGRHLEIYNVALAEIEFSKMVLHAIEQKQSKEQEKEQKEFEVVIAQKDADIARTRAKADGDALKIRAEGEAESARIRAAGQAKAQEIISQTLTPEYLQFKLYDSPNAKLVLLPEKLNAPILINPGEPPKLPTQSIKP